MFKPDEAACLLAERFNIIGWIYKQESIMFNRLASRLAALPTWTWLLVECISENQSYSGCVQKHHLTTLGCHSIFAYVQWTMKIEWHSSLVGWRFWTQLQSVGEQTSFVDLNAYRASGRKQGGSQSIYRFSVRAKERLAIAYLPAARKRKSVCVVGRSLW